MMQTPNPLTGVQADRMDTVLIGLGRAAGAAEGIGFAMSLLSDSGIIVRLSDAQVHSLVEQFTTALKQVTAATSVLERMASKLANDQTS
jgi:hypothetical protein